MECDGQFQPAGADSRAASWQSAVEERLRTLETQQRLFSSSVKGGAVVVYDDDGNQVGRLGVGTISGSAGSRTVPVLSITDPNSNFHLLVDVNEGIIAPAFTYTAVQDTFVPITNASFQNVWKSWTTIVTEIVYVRFLVTADAGTAGEARLSINGIDSGVYTVNAGEQISCTYSWDLAANGLNWGDLGLIRVQGRRLSGSGNINVYAPDEITYRSRSNRPDASANGIPL